MRQAASNSLLAVLATLGIALSATTAVATDQNTAYGVRALAGNTGDINSAFGYFTLGNSNSGVENSALGAHALNFNTSGSYNTASGANSLYSNATGTNNTADGDSALFSNVGGSFNTAEGFRTLYNNTAGANNTANGVSAMQENITGSNNVAVGSSALMLNTASGNNTAVGANSLQNDTGQENTAVGSGALISNLGGNYNTAAGFNSLAQNTSGSSNTAFGLNALLSNNTGYSNTAAGVSAMMRNTTGIRNSALGINSMFNNTTGQNNVALGYFAGYNLTAGNNNIDISNNGLAGEANTIRVGAQGTQTATYIAGILGSAVTGSDVVINSSGRLGVVVSSARYKRDINDMGESTNQLMKLRPVTFRYKDDRQAIMQYGLVAEEVVKIYPELVVRNSDGTIESVRYSMLSAMLLNELQKQTKELKHQERENQDQAELLLSHLRAERQQDQVIVRLEERLSRLERITASNNADRNLATAYNR